MWAGGNRISVKRVDNRRKCIPQMRKVKDILLFYEENVLSAAIVRFKILSCSFLKHESVQLLKEKHWNDWDFRNLTAQCSVGNAEAIDGTSAYFEEKSSANPDAVFYKAASNFWRFRAYLYGNSKAEKELTEWVSGHPNEHI